MVPKREEFILDVRRAARLEQKPTVATDSDLINPDMVSKALQRAALWLTPKVVQAYDPAEFATWPPDLQSELHSAVEGFRTVAQTVPTDKPATAAQFKDGLSAFERLTATIRRVVLAEWTHAVEEVVKQAEQWAGEFCWQTRRQEKKLTETLLGEYSLLRLYFYAEEHLYVLDPLARFVPGALGSFDLSIQPSFYVTSLYRHFDGVWYVNRDVGQGAEGAGKEEWSKDSFRSAVGDLRLLL
ncbi:MAG TPA: hypothetical protein VH682_32980 [Gemmataceae bacterium]